MTWETVRLALGAFVTSSGFGGLAAVCAAAIAYKGIGRRIRADKEMAADKSSAEADAATMSDQRQRWWDALYWVWEHHGDLTDDAVLDLIDSLERGSTTPQQSAMLEAVMDAIFKDGGAAHG